MSEIDRIIDGLESHADNTCNRRTADLMLDAVRLIKKLDQMNDSYIDVITRLSQVVKNEHIRVLDIDEIPDVDGAVLIEWRMENPKLEWGICHQRHGELFYLFTTENLVGRIDLSIRDYRKTWRCWSARPHKYRMELEGWEDEKTVCDAP